MTKRYVTEVIFTEYLHIDVQFMSCHHVVVLSLYTMADLWQADDDWLAG